MAMDEMFKTVKPFSVRTDFTDFVPTDGVSVKFIVKHLTALTGVHTMRDLEGSVMQTTKRFSSSFTELLGNHEQFKESVVESADYFVSFAYDTKLETLVDGLERFRKKAEVDDIFVWISILSVNQHFGRKAGEVAPIVYPKSWFKNAFEKTISTIQNVLFILTPIKNPIALQRLWCIYELYLAEAIKGCTLDVCLSEEDEDTFIDGILQDTTSILQYFDAIDAEKAKASPDQETRLRKRIEEIPGSYATLNSNVRDRLRAWFAHASTSYLEEKKATLQKDQVRYISLLTVVGKLHGELGNYKKAAKIASEALEISLEYYGEEHKETAIILNNLAFALHNQGRLEDAVEFYQQALDIDKKWYGEKDSRVARDLGNIAHLLEDLGNFKAAEPLMRQALEIDRKEWGNGHVKVAIRLSNLGTLLYSMGKFDEAEPLMREALEINLKTLGKDHPSSSTTLNNLSQLLKVRGKLDESEKLLRESLESIKRVYGDRHPDYGTGLSNLAQLLKAKGDLSAAKPLLENAVDILVTSYGREHPDVALAVGNLGGVFYAMGELGEAEKHMREALELTTKLQGEEHHDVAIDLGNLAQVLQAKGELEEAEVLMRKALKITKNKFGEDHLSVASELNNLGQLLRAKVIVLLLKNLKRIVTIRKGDTAGAEELLRKAIRINKKVLGSKNKNQSTVVYLRNLSALLRAKGDKAQASQLLNEANELQGKA